jgi:hypothetical protein
MLGISSRTYQESKGLPTGRDLALPCHNTPQTWLGFIRNVSLWSTIHYYAALYIDMRYSELTCMAISRGKPIGQNL